MKGENHAFDAIVIFELRKKKSRGKQIIELVSGICNVLEQRSELN